MQARSIRGRDNPVYFDKFREALRIGSEGKNRSAVFLKIDLGKHLPTYGLIPNSENELVAPPSRIADSFYHMLQGQQKCACTFSIHASEY